MFGTVNNYSFDVRTGLTPTTTLVLVRATLSSSCDRYSRQIFRATKELYSKIGFDQLRVEEQKFFLLASLLLNIIFILMMIF